MAELFGGRQSTEFGGGSGGDPNARGAEHRPARAAVAREAVLETATFAAAAEERGRRGGRGSILRSRESEIGRPPRGLTAREKGRKERDNREEGLGDPT